MNSVNTVPSPLRLHAAPTSKHYSRILVVIAVLITVTLAVAAAFLVPPTSTDAEFGTATTIHPDAALIGSPSLAFYAWRAATLPHYANSTHVSGIG